ncbi:MAG: redoxin domain-containing protein [Planctomycetes bacterium]|nr:redoxin domain-containing protein [Planctomycetota bacterium]
MRERKGELENLGAQVLVIDPHESYRVAHMLRSSEREGAGAGFPVLADAAGAVSASYGVAMQMRIHGERSNRPATFVIDRDGAIRFQQLATTYSDRPAPEKLMALVRRLAGAPPEPELEVRGKAETPPVRPGQAEAGFTRQRFLEEVSRSKIGYTVATVFHPACPGCLTEAIALAGVEKAWGELGVGILGLAVTALEDPVRRFVKASKAGYRVELAPWALEAFGVRFFPTLIIFDKKGEEVFRAAEDHEDPVGAAREFLESRLKTRGS